MDKNSKIYVAGHRGMVGSAIVRCLEANGYTNLVLRARQDLDLQNQQAVAEFFASEKPEYVFLAAAKVGGIMANNTHPAEFIYENLQIQNNIIHQSYVNGVTKLLFLGSSCIYPRLCLQPMKEEYLLTGLLEPTNEPYAIAKIAGIKMCQSYNRQYGTNFLSAMPTNLYGLGDNYDLQYSHVLPALIRKMHEAKSQDVREVQVWGTGTPKREFLYSEDLADACVILMEKHDASEIGEFINIGTGKEITIKELAGLVAQVVGFRGKLVFDKCKPDGMPRKLMDSSRLTRLGWHPKTRFREGILLAYQDFLNNVLKAA